MDIHAAGALHTSLVFYSAMLPRAAAAKLEANEEGLGIIA